jgi:hypothetical protein
VAKDIGAAVREVCLWFPETEKWSRTIAGLSRARQNVCNLS